MADLMLLSNQERLKSTPACFITTYKLIMSVWLFSLPYYILKLMRGITYKNGQISVEPGQCIYDKQKLSVHRHILRQ